MIVDCHTHIWESPAQLGEPTEPATRGAKAPSGRTDAHLAAADCVDKSLVLGFRSRFLGAEIPNDLIARYVRAHPDRLIGLAGLDPTDPNPRDRLATLADEGFGGVVLSPAGQDFHPADSRAWPVYELCQDRGLFLLVHQGTHFWPRSKMEYARPFLWDEVLRDFPGLTLIIAHLGYPWIEETLALLGKQANAYADFAGLIRRPWQAYNSLVLAHQHSVTHKLLFGSDFPFLTPSEAIENLYRINEFAHGTHLPTVPREALRGIVERNAKAALGL